MSEAALQFKLIEKDIALITLDQPNSRANVLSTAIWSELGSLLSQITVHKEWQGMILQSAKPGIFIAGANLKELADASPEHPEPTLLFLQIGHRVLSQLESLPFPTVALIDGACLGGGFEVALACDYRIAGSNPKCLLGLPEVKLGLIPGWGGTQRFARMVGPLEAAVSIVNSKQYTAKDAHKLWIVDQVVESDQLIPTAIQELRSSGMAWHGIRARKHQPVAEEKMLEMRSQFASMRAHSALTSREDMEVVAECLNVIEKGCVHPLVEGIQYETEAFLRLAGTPHSRKLIQDFFEARKK